MNTQIKYKIEESFKELFSSPKRDLYKRIKSYLYELIDLYKSNTISTMELGYFVLPITQFEDDMLNKENFIEITKNAGLLELPKSQLEQKHYDRQDILEKLIEAINKL